MSDSLVLKQMYDYVLLNNIPNYKQAFDLIVADTKSFAVFITKNKIETMLMIKREDNSIWHYVKDGNFDIYDKMTIN